MGSPRSFACRRAGRSPRELVQSVLAGGGALILATVSVACAPGDPPEVPVGVDGVVDEQLERGRSVYGAQCARCHGADGGGGTGTKLSGGAVVAAYPELLDQVALVTDGRNGMPAFGDRIGDDEIQAVVRYTREILAVE